MENDVLLNIRAKRRFCVLSSIILITIFFIVIHLGMVMDIPYVPRTLCFKIPAILYVTILYGLSMFTLKTMKTKIYMKYHKL